MILGFNCSDDKKIAIEFLRENGATFPMVLDSSEAAVQVGFRGYRMPGVPVNYVIDREGKIAGAVYGYEKGHQRMLAVLKSAGLKIEGE